MKEILCRACGFQATVDKWEPSWCTYSDIQCPECKSTNNEHNSDFKKKLFSQGGVES